MKKIFTLIITFVMIMSQSVLFGCNNKKIPNTPEFLEVYCLDAGYGVEWAEKLLEVFKEQQWVKDKYPGLDVSFDSNDSRSFEGSLLNAGEKNTVDLFFGEGAYGYVGKDNKGNQKLVELTDLVYNEKVPGEEILFKDKMLDSYVESNRYFEKGDDLVLSPYRSFFSSWASGSNGIVYNETLLNQLGIEAPLTTNQLIDASQKISKNTSDVYKKGYAWNRSGDANYFDYLFPIWWAQYEGYDGYKNFYNLIDDSAYSKNIFLQQGRKKSLEVFDALVKFENGAVNPASSSLKFREAQGGFIRGDGLFYAIGNWFENEMKADIIAAKSEGYDYKFKMMKNPVISDIITKTLSIKDEEMLIKVIKEIDAGKTFATAEGLTGVNEFDFEHINVARSVIGSIGTIHTAYVPSYAVAKDVAVDFIRFMATDIANESYMKTTTGCNLPFKYDAKNNTELFNSLTPMAKELNQHFNMTNSPVHVLPAPEAFPSFRYGRLKPLISDKVLFNVFNSVGNTVTPQKMYDETLDYWTNEKFNSLMQDAGI